jgi:hypothetical protein
MKYAVKVWLGDDSLYVSEGLLDNLRVALFDTIEEAQECVYLFNENNERAEVVEYDRGNLD